MEFDASTGMLSCASCGREEPIENIHEDMKIGNDNIQHNEQQQWGNVHSNQDNESASKEYICKNCGAVIFTDADTTATSCSFCGAPVVLSDRLSGSYLPAKVIPFTITKEQATEAFKKWCSKGLLFPDDFKFANRIKSITGMYIPFFLYDLDGHGELNATCTKVKSYSKGDYIYTETSYYNVYREAFVKYNKVPADASEKMNDSLMDKLEPYDYSNLKDFQMPYLAGYLAENYNYNEKDLYPRIQQRVEPYVDSFMKSSIKGYASTRVNYESIQLNPTDTYYTLLPIWMVCYDYQQSEHTFAMNGQTGKIVGTPPISTKKKTIAFFILIGIIFAIELLIEFFMTGGIF